MEVEAVESVQRLEQTEPGAVRREWQAGKARRFRNRNPRGSLPGGRLVVRSIVLVS